MRDKAVKQIIDLVMKAFDTNNYEYIRQAFQMALDFNSENFGIAEIFMSEDDDYVMVDDDMFYFNGRF